MRLPNSQFRRGFTLIELLVVIAIIAVLVALTLGFAFGVLGFAVLVVRLALKSVWAVLVAAMTLVVAALSAPFRLGRWVARHLEARRPALKPAWVPLDDLA